MFTSATFKLTMWYLAIAMVISIGFSVVVYHLAVDELSFGLHHQTARIFQEFPVFNSDPDLRVRSNDVSQGAHHILWQLVYFNILVLATAGLAAYLLARRTLEPIAAAHERQKRFTADVSHELRTPLTSLKMSSEVALLDAKAGKDMLKSALESNLEDAGKMDLLINSLLRLTKLDSEAAQAAFGTVRLRAIVASAIAQVEKTAGLKEIAIDNQVKAVNLHGDGDALTQLLVIILDNAIKYSPAGSRIDIASRKNDRYAIIDITDRGRGISAAALPHVFDRFYRADASRSKTGADGFGLGLSIAKLIVDQHDGVITITSREGHGTTVRIELPLVNAPTAAGERSSSAKQ